MQVCECWDIASYESGIPLFVDIKLVSKKVVQSAENGCLLCAILVAIADHYKWSGGTYRFEYSYRGGIYLSNKSKSKISGKSVRITVSKGLYSVLQISAKIAINGWLTFV